MNAFDVTTNEGSIARFWLSASVYLDRYWSGDLTTVEEHLNLMLEIDPTYLGPEELTVLAEGEYLVLGDPQGALQIQQGLAEPDVPKHLSIAEDTLRAFDARLFKSRLDYLLGERRSPEEIIPDPDDPEQRGLVLLERAICAVGQIWARAWTHEKTRCIDRQNRRDAPTQVAWRKQGSFVLPGSSGLTFRMSKVPLYELVIDAVTEHGPDALVGLHDLFQIEWSDPASRSHWPTSVRRSVIKHFIKAGCSTPWVTQDTSAAG